MSLSTLFTIAIVIILLRVFWLKIKDANLKSESFKKLPPKDQLAVLKECLLNNPTEGNLSNLKDFFVRQGTDLDVESYRPFMKKQLELTRRKDALAEDNELFCNEAAWLDKIRPLEFEEANDARCENRQEDYISNSLEGIARLYSDEAILRELEALAPEYPKAKDLAEDYRKLMELRESSGADDDSLAKLRKAKNAWEDNLLQIDLVAETKQG
jgi:hypothetical protein